MSGAMLQIGDVCNPATILVTPKYIDVIIAHTSRSKLAHFPPRVQAVVEFDMACLSVTIRLQVQHQT